MDELEKAKEERVNLGIKLGQTKEKNDQLEILLKER